MHAIFCGDRNWTDSEEILHSLQALKGAYEHKLVVVTGGATGADSIADALAEQLGITRVIFPANWTGEGPSAPGRSNPAGAIRNQRMLDYVLAQPGGACVVAFHRYLPGSKGTKNMVGIAEKAGVPVRLVPAPKQAATV